MQIIKRFLFILALALSFGAYNNGAYAQEVVVGVRPPIPHYARVPAPSPRHVWIDEDWAPRGGSYVFIGGHWALPPHPGFIWVPGFWRDSPRGHVWVAGRWRHR